MSVWIEVESGTDRRPAPVRRLGYWSGNQGEPIRRPQPESDEPGPFTRTGHLAPLR